MRDTPGAYPGTPNSEHGSRDSRNSRVISAPQSLSHAVKARKAEYVRKKQITIKVGTWNVASIKGTEKDLGAWFVDGLGIKGLSEDLAGLSVESSSVDGPSESQIESVAQQEQRQRKKINTLPKNDVPAVPHGDQVGLYVLGLQEIVDISSATEALRQYTDTHSAKKWTQTMEAALPKGYVKIAEQQLLGLLLLIFAAPGVAETIGSVSTTSVGTGLLGYMGNKGASAARITLGETTRLVFVNCHLAAGSDQTALERRNWDSGQILSRVRFAPVDADNEVAEDATEGIGDEDFAFWFGDLNYRLADLPGDDVRRLLLLHTRNEYDLSNRSKRKIDSELGYVDAVSSEVSSINSDLAQHDSSSSLDPRQDPASLHTTLQSLLPHDELRAQQKSHKAFYDGWREGDINFLPTYKYDVGSIGMFDSGEKKRGPSWCDRILFRTRRDLLEYKGRAKEALEAKTRDADMKARGLDEAASEDDVLFDYDPDADGLTYGDDYDEGEDQANDAVLVRTQDGYQDSISLDHYVSHQRVLSSDHKPLDAVFTLTYDSIIPELRAKVHQDVAKELDKAENEGRPGVTLVVDDLSSETTRNADESAVSTDLSGVNFGSIRYGDPKICGLTVANTGRVPAAFCFIDRPVGEHMLAGTAPPWLSVQIQAQVDHANQELSLAPGDTADIKLTIEISDFEMVRQLNAGLLSLDDILVLRVKDGRDHFIPVRGQWTASCFGHTLDELTRVGEHGVRGSRAATEASPSGDQPRLSAPGELFALTEAIQKLVERTIAEWDMTSAGRQPPWDVHGTSSGWPFDAQTWTLEPGIQRSQLCLAVREALDTSTAVDNHFLPETSSLIRLEVLSETLLLFLRSLNDGIVTADLWSEMESHVLAYDKSKHHVPDEENQTAILDVMSSAPVHSVSFTFLAFMLTKVASEIMSSSLTTTPTPRSPPVPSFSTFNHPHDTTAEANQASPVHSPGRASSSVFPSFRRRNRASTSASNVEEPETTLDSVKRREVEQSFARIFGAVMVRSAIPVTTKEKDRKVLEDRKAAVLEPFLRVST